jgi:putative ABC transport system permease protein
MFKNYLKITFRNMRRHKVYSVINITGLASGIAFCLMILMHIGFERSYDQHHRDADRIYRIGVDIHSPSFSRTFAPISYFMAPYLKESYPQVESVTRIRRAGSVLVRRGEKVFYEDRFIRADNDIFSVLTFPFLQGDPEHALSQPGTVVISESMAHKYFGSENPLGRTLNMDSEDILVTGIVEDPPPNSHLRFDFIASYVGDEVPSWMKQHWNLNTIYTYVKFRPDVEPEKLLARIEEGANSHRDPDSEMKFTYFLQPLRDIHLHSHLSGELAPPGNPTFLLIFGVIAALILIIASINFINLSTARAATRAKEVGMRKIVGAFRKQLIFQFLGESLLTTLSAVLLACVIVIIALPVYGRLTGTLGTMDSLINPGILLALTGIIIFTGLVAGSYPAFVLSAFRPIAILSGKKGEGAKGNGLRRALVIGQFAVSLILISGTIVITQQVRYMKNKDLGFEKEQKLIIPVRTGASISQNYESVKTEFKKHPGVLGAAVSSDVPARLASGANVQLVGEADPMSQWMYYLFVDTDFLPEYGIKPLVGRTFVRERDTQPGTVFMLNETAVRKFGWSQPETALHKTIHSGYGGDEGQIIGVVKDFHFAGLQQEIGPVVIGITPRLYRYITLTLSTEEIGRTLSSIAGTWKAFFPGIPIDYFFLDTDFDRYYRQEEKAASLVLIFGILAVCIACLGILGLAANTTQQKTKEIGIRKVIGASAARIVGLLTGNFIKWILFANLIAWPASYLILNRWLEGFAYRTDYSLWFLVIPSAVILCLAVLTVSFNTIRAALANPVESLRHE